MTDKEPCDVIKHELRWLEKALKSRVKIGCTRQEDTGPFNVSIAIDGRAHDFPLSAEKFEKRQFTELFNKISTWEESLSGGENRK